MLLEIFHGVIHQHFLSASTLSSERIKASLEEDPKIQCYRSPCLHPNLQGYTEITSTFDKHSLCNGAGLVVRWPKLGHKSNAL